MFFASVMLLASTQTAGSEPKDAMGWFIRAQDQMALRSPGSAPFHMKVAFHAFPGTGLVGKKKPQIITGDGIYEETWISPQQWRREVTLGSYDAVEVQSSRRSRKMQFSSDYEPSRILMLLEALLNPISRDVVSPDLRDDPQHWKMEHLSAGSVPFVRITTSTSAANSATIATGYVFLSDGLLVQFNDDGLVTSWKDQVLFAGKVFPRHLSVQAEGVRDLLTADVTVEAAGNTDPTIFELSVEEADIGITLRPLHSFEVKRQVCISPNGSWSSIGRTSRPEPITHAVIDRHGLIREVELISNEYLGDGVVEGILDFTRTERFRPAKIDGSPTEIAFPMHWVSR